MGAEQSRRPVQRDWLSKTLAGLVLGGVLAIACSGLFSRVNAGIPLAVRGQLAMWMVPPIWLSVLSAVYFFSSGVRAWLWLGAASAFVAGLLYLL
ncbi:hypothetical protein [Zoogloea sp.]|jgi:hypothetical protein|uniref:hypothetical protein n=1 Tax=Zoogloea sp. TaxID=49181 RepID=UPI0037D9AF28